MMHYAADKKSTPNGAIFTIYTLFAIQEINSVMLKITTPAVQPIRTASGLYFLYMAIHKVSIILAKRAALEKKLTLISYITPKEKQ